MKKNLFRKETLDALEHPGQVNDFVRVTTPPLYILLTAMTLCVAVACLWVALGTATEQVKTMGVMFPHDKPYRVTASHNGTVDSLLVARGDRVKPGTPLLIMRTTSTDSGTRDTIHANVAGIVIDIAHEDDDCKATKTVAEIIPQKGTHTNRELITFVEYKHLSKLQVGQKVQVTPVDLHREDYGYITGRIVRISHFPIMQNDAQHEASIRHFADKIFPTEAAYEVKILLDTDPADTRRLRWSREKSRDIQLSVMAFCHIQMITERKNIYKMLLKF